MKTYRQGDVLLVPVNEIPSGLKTVKKLTLALGEVTGHHHSIYGGGAVGFADDEEALADYVSVSAPEGVELVHQEHDTITIPKGTYQNVRQQEYTFQQMRPVAD